jgi:nucleoside-diphosphate-sugar epimerase
VAKYLVTGGAGFIGSHLAEKLVERGDEVVVLDNFSTGKRDNVATFVDRIELVEGSVTDAAALRGCLEGVDVVFHQAALASVPRSVADPLRSNEHNVTGTLNVFWHARELGVRRVVYAASSSVYGDTEVLPKHEDMRPRPQSPYAVTKHVAELYGAVFSDLYGLETIGLRYFNVFGARQDPESQYAAVIPIFVTRLLAGRAPLIYGDGEQSRDFTYIDNVVDANLAAAAAPAAAAGRTFNIACGVRVTINELYAKIQDLIGSAIEAVHAEPRSGDVRHSLADIALAEQLMNYRPQISLDEGLGRTVEWYRAQL